uniref:Uncharacterized protein n=1 Tax=Anguilla anguilla TaxID=7936 RepID=A0A0E9V657_ANGAN
MTSIYLPTQHTPPRIKQQEPNFLHVSRIFVSTGS